MSHAAVEPLPLSLDIIICPNASVIFLHQVKIAIIGLTAGGVGLDFSSARNVVFLELPKDPSWMNQVQ